MRRSISCLLLCLWWLLCVSVCLQAAGRSRSTYLDQIRGLNDEDRRGPWRPLLPDPAAESIVSHRDFPKGFFRVRKIARVRHSGDSILVEGDLSAIRFDRKSGGIRDVRMRDRLFPRVWLGETILVTGDGRTLRGRDFQGHLKVSETDDFIVLSGDFDINGAAGDRYGRVRLTYQVDSCTGFTSATMEALTGLPNVVKLTFRYTLGRDSARLMPDLFMIDEGGIWLTGEPTSRPICYYELYPDRPALIMPRSSIKISNEYGGGRYFYAKQTDGRIGLEVICPGWWNADFDEAARSDDRSDMFMRVGVRAGDEAFMDVHFINRKAGRDIPSGAVYRTCFSALPFRKLRPFAESYSGHRFNSGTVGELKEAAQLAKRLAGMGVTSLIGATGVFIKDDGKGDREMGIPEQIVPDLAHRCGLRSMWYIGLNGSYNGFTVGFLNERYSLDDAMRDYYTTNLGWPSDTYDPSAYRDDWPYFPHLRGPDATIGSCINAPAWREYLLNNIGTNVIGRLPHIRALYVDDFISSQCTNSAHGCSPLGSTWIMGEYDYTRRVKKMLDASGGNAYLAVHCGIPFTNAFGHADFNVNGEQSMHQMISSRTELNTAYNTSLLHGVQGCYYTASPSMGLPFTTRLFELALSRCHQVNFNYYEPHLGYAPDGLPYSYTEADIKRHQKYMGPLQIFDIARSELHHPFDSDYTSLCKAGVPGIRVVLYARKTDVLMTVAREGVAVKRAPGEPAVLDVDRKYPPVPVELNLKKLGFTGSTVWAYDTTGRKLTRYSTRGGWLKLPPIDVNDGPKIFRIVAAAKEPRVLWHDVVGWRVARTVASARREFAFDMAGAPGHSGTVLVLCGDRGKPSAVGGDAKLLSYDAKHRLATVRVSYGEDTAVGKVRMVFARRSGSR